MTGRPSLHLKVRAALGLCLFLLCVCAGAAIASVPGPAVEELPSTDAYNDALSEEDPAHWTIELTDQDAAEELPHTGLDRSGAADLLRAVFRGQLEGAAGIYDNLEVERFLADDVAVVSAAELSDGEHAEADSEGPSLLTSSIPMRTDAGTGPDAVIDLGLESVEGSLQPANSLSPVEIPSDLGAGIRLPEQGITIDLVGAPQERSPSTLVDTTAFYPNIELDSDLVVAPTPIGVETFTQLRSPDAPKTQIFDLTLPEGAQLAETSDGGAEISRDGQVMVRIWPPSAIDAAGNALPVTLNVEGSRLDIQVEPPVNAPYPILVDPYFEYVQWDKEWSQDPSGYGLDGWYVMSNTSAYVALDRLNIEGQNVYGPILSSGLPGSVVANSSTSWNYHVPRYHTDYMNYLPSVRPTTFITKVNLSRLKFWFSGYQPSRRHSPAFIGGIWDTASNGWVSVSTRTGVDGELLDPLYVYNYNNPNNNENAQIFGLVLHSQEAGANPPRLLVVGTTEIGLSDPDTPVFDLVQSPTDWVNNLPSATVPFVATDYGLGVHKLRLGEQGPTASYTAETLEGCTGANKDPCPRHWKSSDQSSPQLKYDPSTMAQGENWAPLKVRDPLNREASTTVRLKVDHAPPTLALSGTLTEQGTLGSGRAQYTLKSVATDGSEAAAAPLPPFGKAGTTVDATERPMGIATDGQGNFWVVDRINNRVVKFSESGQYLDHFGSFGAGNGQFNDPRGIAITSSGKIWVTDVGNSRVQQFNADGDFLQKFGQKATASEKGRDASTGFLEPWGIVSGSGGTLWVSDPAVGRVGLFRENDPANRFIRNASGLGWISEGTAPTFQRGLAKDRFGNVWLADAGTNMVYAFNSDGTYQKRFGVIGTAPGQFDNLMNLAIAPNGHIFVLDGLDRVQEFMPDGEFLRQFATKGTGSGQLFESRGLTIGKDNTILVTDAGNHRVSRWGNASKDPQSGVGAVRIEVDGQQVEPEFAPGCENKNCSLTREWTLNANAFPPGQHTLAVTAKDDVGQSVTKELAFSTTKDNSAPSMQLNSSPSFFDVPGGWLEQRSYLYMVTASDAGYGVKSISLKVDGNTVGSVEQKCLTGACSRMLFGSIDMSSYTGGAHSAELVATDEAGNSTKKSWTINVVPKGSIDTEEAEATLEASEETSPINVVGEAEEEPEVEGTAEGLGVVAWADELEVVGTEAPTRIDVDPGGGFTVKIPNSAMLEGPCPDAESLGTGESSEYTGVEEEELAESQPLNCEPGGESEVPALVPVEVTPIAVAGGATDSVPTDNDAAAVAANIAPSVDLVTRPLYDGGMTFAAIRDKAAPQQYSWHVSLGPDQELKQIDSKQAVVYYEGGRPAFTISARSARDALGKVVPTSLAVSGGNVVTLTVSHTSAAPEGGSFIYPVVAGAGWEGGFQTHYVIMPPPQPMPGEPAPSEEEEGAEVISEGDGHFRYSATIVGPPMASTSAVPAAASQPAGIKPQKRAYNFFECRYYNGEPHGPNTPIGSRPKAAVEQEIRKGCHGVIDAPDGNREIRWAFSMHGIFHFKYGKWVWINEHPDCIKWGLPYQKPAIVKCFAKEPIPSQERLNIVAYLRLRPEAAFAGVGQSECLEFNGVLPLRPNDSRPFYGKQHLRYDLVSPYDNCNWGQFTQVVY